MVFIKLEKTSSSKANDEDFFGYSFNEASENTFINIVRI
jgi:hypothetical protein